MYENTKHFIIAFATRYRYAITRDKHHICKPKYRINLRHGVETLKIVHTFCSYGSILNELTLQKELQKVMKNMCFGQNITNTTTTKKQHKHPC